MRFSLDGRVLTVQLLPPERNQSFETVSGAEISATCGTNVAAPPGDPRRETTVFRRWPAGQTSLSYRFPRDVSSWCRLDRQSVGIVASVSFPVAWSGAREQIAETANNWARHVRLQPSDLHRLHEPDRLRAGEGVRTGVIDTGLQGEGTEWAAEHRGATVQKIAISGDRAAATLSNDEIVQLRRTATGEWLIDKIGPVGAVGLMPRLGRRQIEGHADRAAWDDAAQRAE